MLPSARAITRRALIFATAAALSLSSLAAGGAASVDELAELSQRAWSCEPDLLPQVYAPDGVHTATFYDVTREYTGPDEIEAVTCMGVVNPVAPRIDIPAADGEWRWADFIDLAGGSTCLWKAVDGQVVRHDCLLPEYGSGNRPRVGLADSSTSAAIDEIETRLDQAWGTEGSLEALQAVYAPDAVHSVRSLRSTRTYEGPEQIASVASMPVTMTQIGERVVYDAPEGELAWAEVYDLGGGAVCLFRARDGMVIRHDCVLQISM